MRSLQAGLKGQNVKPVLAVSNGKDAMLNGRIPKTELRRTFFSGMRF
jgi:hypothetical protein